MNGAKLMRGFEAYITTQETKQQRTSKKIQFSVRSFAARENHALNP